MSVRKHFPLRVDTRVWALVERLAAAELRSTNAQAEILLREALEARGLDPNPNPGRRRAR